MQPFLRMMTGGVVLCLAFGGRSVRLYTSENETNREWTGMTRRTAGGFLCSIHRPLSFPNADEKKRWKRIDGKG